MSTNPNTSAAENLFSNTVQGGIPVPAASENSQDSLRTGEAFLEVLDQVRNGKTEKNADMLYNTLSARADAASSLKDFRKGGASRENVKVVKIHLKRTRASEKLRKLDEQKAAVSSAAPQNGKRIPTQENFAVAQEAAPIQQEQADMQDVANTIDFKAPSSSDALSEQQETPFVSTDEITAADILIHSAIQATLTPLPQTQQAPVNEQMPESTALSSAFLPQEEKVAEPVRPQVALPEQKQEIQPEEPVEEQKAFDLAPAETFIQKQDNRPEKPVMTVAAEQPEKIQDDQPVKPVDHKTVKTAPVLFEKASKKTADFRPASVDMANTQEVQSFDRDYSSPQAHRQAEQLAHELPAQTNIAITVQTQVPIVQEFTLSHSAPSRSSSVKTAKTADTETTEPVIEEKENQKVSVPAKELTLQSVKTEHSRSSDQETKQADQPNGLVALPVQSKSLSADSVTPQAEGQVTEIGAPSVSQTPVAALSVGHELKGKAVSGNVPVQKNVPVNELVDQIKVNIKKALKDGLDKIDIVLKPKELGTIKIHLEIGKDGTMKAVLSTARAETLDLLRSDLTTLKQALADSGFDLNDQAFSFNYRGERFNEDQHHTHKHTVPFVNSEEEDSEVDSVLSANTLSISGRYALNIRV